MINTNLFQNESAIGKISYDYLADMKLGRLCFIMTAEEYTSFIQVLSQPLIIKKEIEERQKIITDFNKYPVLIEKLCEICDLIILQEEPMPLFNEDKDFVTERYLNSMSEAVNMLLMISTQFELCNFSSTALLQMQIDFDIADEAQKFLQKMREICNIVMSKKYTLRIECGEEFKFVYASLFSQESLNSFQQLKNVFQWYKKTAMPKNIISFGDNIDLENQINGISGDSSVIPENQSLGKLLRHILGLTNTVRKKIKKNASELKKQLLFFSAAMKIEHFMTSCNIPITTPIIVENGNINAKSIYDIGLAAEKAIQAGISTKLNIVPNDFDEESNTYCFISGANMGGKTTFVKSIGIACLFAQCGLKVAAKEFTAPIYENFISHFPSDEDETFSMGKLAEELSRLKSNVPLISKKAILIMNESFSTTTEREGAELADEFLKAISFASPTVFMVTHNLTLLKHIDELETVLENKIKTVSYIASIYDDPIKRGYKIIRAPIQEKIRSIEFLKELQIL
ncbi:MAG: MutS-related protein [Eubacteriales bacterium]